jgi:hypothetical protein
MMVMMVMLMMMMMMMGIHVRPWRWSHPDAASYLGRALSPVGWPSATGRPG